MAAPFLAQLATDLTEKYGAKIGQVTMVFPNRRAGLFFRKHLAQQINKPVWSPEILSIEDFFNRLSNYRIADRLSQVFELFGAFRDHQPMSEAFDKFYYWGEVLLQDFNEIDKHLVKPDDLFYLLEAQKQLENRYDYLSEEQRAVIAAFWKSYTGLAEGERAFAQVWQILGSVYQGFGERLKTQGLTYEGKQQREVAESCQANTLENPFEKVVFAGFNALSKAENITIKHFVSHHEAEVAWDADAYYLDQEQQEAGEFLRQYHKDRVLGKFFPTPAPEQLQAAKEKITITGVPLAVGQAKALGHQLSERTTAPDFDPEKTVVVLPDENLLFPVLHSLPENISTYNVTMGYPLRQTLLYAFLEHALALQQGKRGRASNTAYPYRHVLALLRHPFVLQYKPEVAAKHIKDIEGRNRLWIKAESLQDEHAFFKVLFAPLEEESDLFEYLLTLIRYIRNHLPKEAEDEQAVEAEYLYQFYLNINRLRDITQHQTPPLKLETLLRLFRTLIRQLRIPFSGEPLNGLQIMGTLETRNLDFDEVYILSLNEDTFPAAANRSSFIPYNLRKGFGLPTFDQTDAVSAYLFYRLLHQAKRVHLFYNTEDTSQMKGEPSRFIQQLRYEIGWDIEEKVLAHPIKLSAPQEIRVAKTSEVLKAMERWRSDLYPEKKGLTPSALSTYLNCTLQFYFKYVASIRQADEVDEIVDARIFGNLMHNTLESLYLAHHAHFSRTEIRKEDFTWLRQQMPNELEHWFKHEFGMHKKERFTYEGRNVLIREVISQLIGRVLSNDESYAPFTMIGLEVGREKDPDMALHIPLEESQHTVKIDGIIDRIDEKEGVVRVIDYKTGKDDRKIPDLESLFDRHQKKRNKAAFQTLLYGLLYRAKYPADGKSIAPGLFNAREMFEDDFDHRLKLGKTNKAIALDDFDTVAEPYRDLLTHLIQELYNPNIKFEQTNELDRCKLCDYAGICHRN